MAAALASQALAFLTSHALAATAVTGACLVLLQLARHALADADFCALAALRAYPRRGAFAGQVVLIVGASSGIGEALALEFARGGATVLLAARRMELLLALAERCLAEGAPASEAVKLDVTALEAHEATLDYLLRKYKRIDVLCNNAGRSQRGLVEATPAAVDLELFQLNFFSVVAFTKALLRRALAAGAALRVLNTSSVAGKLGSPLSASYAASKHALQGWMDTLRMEMGWRGVTVTNACPGPVDSEITLHSFTDTPGKAMGVREDGSKRMGAARCALLMAAACHAGLPEVWLAPQPILFFVYMQQYCRGLYFSLSPTLGRQRVQGWHAGVKGYGSLSLTGALGGGGGSAGAKEE